MCMPNPNKIHLKHFIEKAGQRVTTIAYRFIKNLESDFSKVEYGASQFRKLKNNEGWNRKAHNATAIGRMKKYPVVVFVDSNITFDNLEKLLRKYLYYFGVKGLKHSDTTTRIVGQNEEGFKTLLQFAQKKNEALHIYYDPSEKLYSF